MTDLKKPDWLRVSYNAEAVEEIALMMRDLGLNTVCREANCPNIGECYKKHTATFMIMGNHCTRNCRFCNIISAKPMPLDPNEPENVARAAKQLNLHHVVITSVTRDDLPDGGASHFAKVISFIKSQAPNTTVEVLIPDLEGRECDLDTVMSAKPDVLNHNVETVKELYDAVRPQAIYTRSLAVLDYVKKTYPTALVKTGFMVGLGETEEQIASLLDDISAVKCDILTIGQYLRPSAQHAELHRYATLNEFEKYKEMALARGILHVTSTPLARSSYHAAEAVHEITKLGS